MNKDKLLSMCQSVLKDCIQYHEENGHGNLEAAYLVEEISKVYTGPACSLKYDMQTGRMIEVTLEEL
jgi:hypothetical protein